MNKNLNRRIHPIIKIDGLSPKYLVKKMYLCATLSDSRIDYTSADRQQKFVGTFSFFYQKN